MGETQPGERQPDGAGVYDRFPARREPRVHPGERAAERELEVEGGVDDHRQEGEQCDERPEIGRVERVRARDAAQSVVHEADHGGAGREVGGVAEHRARR